MKRGMGVLIMTVDWIQGYVRRLGDGVRDRQAAVNCRWLIEGSAAEKAIDGKQVRRLWVPVR